MTCGSGNRRQTRTKLITEKNGGSCQGEGEKTEMCEENPSPSNCILDNWGNWGDCTGSCDTGGIQVRSREVKQEATPCGQPCDTNQMETQDCEIKGCSTTTG